MNYQLRHFATRLPPAKVEWQAAVCWLLAVLVVAGCAGSTRRNANRVVLPTDAGARAAEPLGGADSAALKPVQPPISPPIAAAQVAVSRSMSNVVQAAHLAPVDPAAPSGERNEPALLTRCSAVKLTPIEGSADAMSAETLTPLPPIEAVGYAEPVGAAQTVKLASQRSGAEEIPPPPLTGRVRLEDRLRIPSELPGSGAAPIQLPPYDFDHPQLRSKVVDELFPDPPDIARVTPPRPDGAGRPMTLKQLQDIAIQNSPLLPQASGDVTAAFGNAIQQGTHPNPLIGYEADTVGSAYTRNYSGIYGSQTIKTAGKLGLARSVANFDAMNQQLNFRRTRAQLLADVRNGYFSVLVAQESMAINSALVRFTTEAYRIQVDKLKAGAGAGYEPAQMRTLAVQAKAALVQSQNRYISAWKQLAATMGVPDMPPTELEGRADMPAPRLNYDAALAWVLNNHTDVLSGRNSMSQAGTNLRLQQITPVPDLQLYGTFQRDFTTPYDHRTTYNVQFGVPVPIYDRNKGGIIQAEGGVRRAAEEMRRARNALTMQVADAFERLETNRVQSELYREQILPDLARAYRGVYQRHQQESAQVGFGDVIVAQQNLAVAIATYVAALSMQWQAVVDISNLMQLDDLWTLYGGQPPAEVQPPAADAAKPAIKDPTLSPAAPVKPVTPEAPK